MAERLPASPGKIYLLPSLITTLSLLSGFYAIISTVNGHYAYAAVAILVAGVFDGLDGRVARLTGTSCQFGKEYDSLCDLVSFGVAPGLLAYEWVLKPFGRFGWLAGFLYVAATALRLARFNTHVSKELQKNFTGLPCPAAAGMISTSVIFSQYLVITPARRDLGVLCLVYLLSYLMVSTHRYLSFKSRAATRAKNFQAVVGVVVLVMLIATAPKVTLFSVVCLYILSGPLGDLYRLLRHRGDEGELQAGEDCPPEETRHP